ncbi:MAG TPA: DUF4173 domain-containing protein [Fimbriimonadaceae bacterium]|nr:DUF4173 domain-containing protein [Fimbriimonadaceae bacterium]
MDHGSWGVGFPLWTLVLLGATYGLARSCGVRLRSGFWWTAPVILALSGSFAWRDAPELHALNMFGILIALGMMLQRSRIGSVKIASVFDYTLGSFVEFVLLTAHPILLALHDVKWSAMAEKSGGRRFAGVLRGLIIAAPILIVFGSLMASADAVFRSLLTPSLDFSDLFERAFFAGMVAWIACGLLRRILYSDPPHSPQSTSGRPGSEGKWQGPPGQQPPVASAPQQHSKIGITEVAIVLGSLNLLFLAFVSVQFSYLFGGRSHVMVTPSLSFAEYARSGFFELVTVAGLVLPLVLGLNWVLRRDSTKDEKIFRCLSGILITLVFVVIFSALERMRLYVDTYGLTHLRLYSTAFMGWLALSFLWLLATVLRGKEDRFAFGAAIASFLVIFSTNAVNPDALIAKVNLNSGRQSVDLETLGDLSADAAPIIHTALPRLEAEERSYLLESVSKTQEIEDWRSWNLGKASVKRLLGETEP